MMLAAGTISEFIDRHPSLKMLALSFLVVVGTVLIAEAFEVHVPKGYVYFAMAFSLGVEALNIRMRLARGRKEIEPVKLRKDIPGQ
jgi:predicted tellurium resistance membrane protein TerC